MTKVTVWIQTKMTRKVRLPTEFNQPSAPQKYSEAYPYRGQL